MTKLKKGSKPRFEHFRLSNIVSDFEIRILDLGDLLPNNFRVFH